MPSLKPLYLPRQTGFTAIELMVVVSIIAILAALAAPSFTPLIERWRVREAAENLTSTIYFARSEAIKRGGNIIIEKKPNSGSCTTAGTATEWGCGWQVFFDVNNNGTQDACNSAVTPNECTLQTLAAPTKVMVSFASSTGKIAVDRWGMMSHAGSGTNTPTAMEFIFFPQNKTSADPSASKTCLNAGGRVASKKISDSC